MARPRSQSREWIENLPPGAFFFAHEVPGDPATAKSVLSRLAADPDHSVERQQRGFYHVAKDNGSRRVLENRVTGALKLAGEGGGAGVFALNRAGWTRQHPARYDFATLGRPPRSPWRSIRFRRRSNRRRAALSPAEVTLIEAVRAYGRVESDDWDETLDRVRSGRTQRRMLMPGPLRADAIEWATETENGLAPECRDRMRQLCAAVRESDRSTLAGRGTQNRRS